MCLCACVFVFACVPQLTGMRAHFAATEDGTLTAVLIFPRKPELLNVYGAVHGGLIATMVDTVTWFASTLHHTGWVRLESVVPLPLWL